MGFVTGAVLFALAIVRMLINCVLYPGALAGNPGLIVCVCVCVGVMPDVNLTMTIIRP